MLEPIAVIKENGTEWNVYHRNFFLFQGLQTKKGVIDLILNAPDMDFARNFARLNKFPNWQEATLKEVDVQKDFQIIESGKCQIIFPAFEKNGHGCLYTTRNMAEYILDVGVRGNEQFKLREARTLKA